MCQRFFEEFSQLLGHLTVSSGKLLLLGDFNFHVDGPEKDPQAARFLELLDLHNLSQHVTLYILTEATIPLILL